MSVLNCQPKVYRGEPDPAVTDIKSFSSKSLSGCYWSGSELCIFSVPLTHQARRKLEFSARCIFLEVFKKTLSPFALKCRNPFHVIWEGRKKKVLCCCFFPLPLLFNPNYFSGNYPAGVYTFFSRTLWPCCGRSELWPHYRSSLAPPPPSPTAALQHTVKAPPPPLRFLSHKVAQLLCLQ